MWILKVNLGQRVESLPLVQDSIAAELLRLKNHGLFEPVSHHILIYFSLVKFLVFFSYSFCFLYFSFLFVGCEFSSVLVKNYYRKLGAYMLKSGEGSPSLVALEICCCIEDSIISSILEAQENNRTEFLLNTWRSF